MAKWRKTTRNGKITTTKTTDGSGSVSVQTVKSNNLTINNRYVGGKTIKRTTTKSGGYVRVEQKTTAKATKAVKTKAPTKASSRQKEKEADFVFGTMTACLYLIALPLIITWKISKFVIKEAYVYLRSRTDFNK